MADNSKIGWTSATWPVVTGCTHISEGCDHCYAAKLTSGRLKHWPEYAGLAENGRFNGQVRCLPDRLTWPYKWRKPRRIFVSDMADLFHESVPDGFIAWVWDVMGQNQQHTFQVLTKRHARMRSFAKRWADHAEQGSPKLVRGPDATAEAHPSGRGQLFAAMLREMGDPPEGCAYPTFDWMEGQRWWPSDLFNVWMGVSAENQRWADIRVPSLLDTPAAVRFVSAEPLLGPIDLHWVAGINALEEDWAGSAAGGTGAPHPLLNWVIVGGESGPGHRQMDIGWLESIVTQCRDAGVPVYVKQDSGPRAGQQGRIPDDLWIHEFPDDPPRRAAA
jgi:protein gp37